MLKLLIAQLSDVLGDRIEVERAGGRFRKSDEIKSVQIVLVTTPCAPKCRAPESRAALGTPRAAFAFGASNRMDAWLGRLLTTLNKEAAHSEQTRLALEHIVIGESS